MSKEKEEVPPAVEEDEKDESFVAPKKVELSDLLKADAADESLKKYKETLLGAAATGGLKSDDPRRVVVLKLRILFENRPGGNIEFDLSTPAGLETLKNTSFILREGCKYKTEITFRVQNDIVSGLLWKNVVKLKGVPVERQKLMLGSFGPQAQPHVVTLPRHGWDEAPSGFMARHDYKAQSVYTDDDGADHLKYEYAFSIKKEWA